MSDNPVTIKELKNLIKDLDDNVECFVELLNDKQRPIIDIGIIESWSTYNPKKNKKLLIKYFW